MNAASSIRKADGSKINSTSEHMEEWNAYFENLLNVDPNNQDGTTNLEPARVDIRINIGPITIEEIRIAVNQLKNGKVAGWDHAITPETLKYGGEWVINQVRDVCNKIFNSHAVLNQLRTNVILSIPKKSGKTSTTNYRDISLLSIAAKR
jgi:hypothetical protein